MAPSNLVLRAEPWAFLAHPVTFLRPHIEDPFSLGRKFSHSNLTTDCFWAIRNSGFLGQSTILYGDYGLDFLYALIRYPSKSLGSSPMANRRCGIGRAAKPSSILQGRGFCLEEVRGLEEGEGVERPPFFSPDQGEEMQVH